MKQFLFQGNAKLFGICRVIEGADKIEAMKQINQEGLVFMSCVEITEEMIEE